MRRSLFGECNDGVETQSSVLQRETEADCLEMFADRLPGFDALEGCSGDTQEESSGGGMMNDVRLLRKLTVEYLRRGLEKPLGRSYTSLDASRPWLIYWMLHALTVLDAFPTDLVEGIREALAVCKLENGEGFGGGFMQMGHTAPTYAAVLSICCLGDEQSLALIDREGIYRFFMAMKKPNGGFSVQEDGEVDMRGLYTVLSVADILNILTDDLIENCCEFVGSCQTYEGGIGAEPGCEAHGGYSFCGLAALAIISKKRDDAFKVLDIEAFVAWITARQMKCEGGFQGRTNKLVDSCYSFWQGATPAILQDHLGIALTDSEEGTGEMIFDQIALQKYILICAQDTEHGGLRDKIGKFRDQYHTAYALSGLSVSQRAETIYGALENQLLTTDPVHNVQVDRLQRAKEHFANLPPVT